MKKRVMQSRIGVLAMRIGMSDDPDEVMRMEPTDVADAVIAAGQGDMLRAFLSQFVLGYDAVEKRFYSLNYGVEWLDWQQLRRDRSLERLDDLGMWE